MELTRIHRDFKGDAFFPDINWNEWTLTDETQKKTDDDLPFSFLTYERITL